MASSSAQQFPQSSEGGNSSGLEGSTANSERRGTLEVQRKPTTKRPSSLIALMVLDGVVAAAGTAIAFVAGNGLQPLAASPHVIIAAAYIAILLLGLRGFGAYAPGHSTITAALKSVAVASVIILALLRATETDFEPFPFAISVALVNGVILAGWRYLYGTAVKPTASDRCKRVLIIGAGALGVQLSERISTRDGSRTVRGFLDDRNVSGAHVLGRLSDFERIAQAHFIDETLITISLHRPGVLRIIEQAREHNIQVRLIPGFAGHAGSQIEFVGGVASIALHDEKGAGFPRFCKRVLDVIASAFLLVITAPLLLAICIAIKLDSPGPVLYCADRIGKKGRRFCFYKFRSMVADADALKDNLRQNNEREGPFFKMENDPRITQIGAFLRRTSLDELPQLWNVLKGDMSLVGPRPHPVDDFKRYRLEHLRRLNVTPGITGLWQVTARRDPSFERNMALDIEYISRWSLWMDLQILLKTLPAVLQGDGR